MPGFDGIGPLGLGPMSGYGRGFCALKLPARSGDAITGFAGRAGWPVAIQILEPSVELPALREQAMRLEKALCDFRQRIRRLESAEEQRARMIPEIRKGGFA